VQPTSVVLDSLRGVAINMGISAK